MFYREDLGSWKNECPVVRDVLKLDILFWRGLVLFSKGHIKPWQRSLFFTLTPQSTKKYEIPGRRTPQPSFCPVLTLLSLPCHHVPSFSDVHQIPLIVIYCRFFPLPFSPSVVYARASSHPLAFVSSKFFLFLLPTSRRWTGITRTFPDSSWRTPVCAWVLAVYLSIC